MNNRYFVYLLLDNDRPFYVGCSCDPRRPRAHMTDARKGIGGNGRKNAVIRRILAEGRKPQWRKISEGLTRAEALALERATILKLAPGLSNIVGTSKASLATIAAEIAEEAEIARLRALLSAAIRRLMKFDPTAEKLLDEIMPQGDPDDGLEGAFGDEGGDK